MNNIGWLAGADIYPRRIVVQNGNFQVIQSTASPAQPPIGISTEATRRPPNAGFTNGDLAAIADEEIRIYQLNEQALLDAGAPISAGAPIKSDANGRGVTASTGNYVVGFALQAATASNQQILVKIQPGTL